jgi:DNA primase catalytic subunit
MVKRGATSFHCSEEIWSNPLDIQTGMKEIELNKLRIGWDLLIDVDCKWFDYSKKAAQSIIAVLKNNSVKNFGIKFSGGKGFHIIVPGKSFPKLINGVSTKDLFPELPRKIVAYIRSESEKELKKNLPEEFYQEFKDVKIKRGIKCNKCGEIAREYIEQKLFCERCKVGESKKIEKTNNSIVPKCPDCGKLFNNVSSKEFYECTKCKINSIKKPEAFSKSVEVDLFELMGLDLILVSPRHLFRMPYSLHEKTSMASIVLTEDELENFDIKDANPLKLKESNIRNFFPNSKEDEAHKLVVQALDWYKNLRSIFNGLSINLKEKYIDDAEKLLNELKERFK